MNMKNMKNMNPVRVDGVRHQVPPWLHTVLIYLVHNYLNYSTVQLKNFVPYCLY